MMQNREVPRQGQKKTEGSHSMRDNGNNEE